MDEKKADKKPKLPLGVKIFIGYMGLMLVTVCVMQVTSILDFETAVSLGFQEDDPNSADPFVRGRVLLEQGTAGADLIIQGLLCIAAILGLLFRSGIGFACAFGQLGISIYWPTFDILQESVLFTKGVSDELIVGNIVGEVFYIILALVMAVVLFRHRKLFF